MGFIYLEPGYRITLCWRARHRSRVRVARAMMVMTIVRGALANPRLSPLMGSVAAWRVCLVVGARKAVVRGGGCGGGLTRRFGRGASARALTWTRGGERMRGGRFAFVRASSLSSSVSSRDEGEDDDDEGYDDEDEEVGESFYVGDVECVCDVMVMDEEDDDDDVNSASPSRGSGGVDVSVLRREVEEDARAMIRLLLSASSTPGMKRMRAALPRSMSHLELSVALCSDEYIRSLNAGFRSKDSATDVLSFPAESFGPMAVLGDVVVSVDTASRQAEEVGHSLRDECRVLLVHGTLHLLGLDHELSEVDAEVMAAAEQEVLSALGWKVTGLTRRASGDADGVDVSIQRRVLVVDLDGTLLNGKSVITPRTADALRRALASGVEVVVATGKARPAAIRAAATAGLSGSGGIVGNETPGVFLQGLEVYGRGGALVYEASMSQDVTRDAFVMMQDVVHKGLALTAFCGDTCATLASSSLLDELHHTFHEPVSEVVPSVDDLLATRGVRKLLLMGPSKASIDGVRSIWEAAFKGRAEVTQAVPTMLEILPLGNDKSRGVMKLLHSMNVNPQMDVCAVGDGENDAEMLRVVGCGVAMSNASEKTKALADHVLEASNDEDGVAEAIDRFVL